MAMANNGLKLIWDAAKKQLQVATEGKDLQKIRHTLISIQRSTVTVEEEVLTRARARLAELSTENLRNMMNYRNYWALDEAIKDAQKDGVRFDIMQEAKDLLQALAQDVIDRLTDGMAKRDQAIIRMALE